ncbi:MAG: amidase [candidate division NC10 bacterium]|nr:amidase [candidate division NC10 bacterium]
MFSLPESRPPNPKALEDVPRQAPITPHEKLTIATAARRVREGALTCMELLTKALQQIRQQNSKLNAFVHIMEEEALRHAETLDAERKRGHLRGPLHGIPISVKDVIHVQGVKTTASSKVMADFVPPYDATAVALLKKMGAVIIGKTSTHEFALGVTTPQSRNPWDPTRLPGGSSGGSAISIATGMSLGSLGTDTRASIRIPASLSGVVGYKPTFGLVSTYGVVTLSWSMDHVAPMASTVEDIALLLNVIVGHDPKDPATVDRPKEDYIRYLRKSIKGLKLGVPVYSLYDAHWEVESAFGEAIRTFQTLGAEVTRIEEPGLEDFQQVNAAGLIVSRCEAAAFHRSFSTRRSLYTEDVFEQLDEASSVLATNYIQAQRFRAHFLERMLTLFRRFDALAMPTSPVPAPRIEESERFLLILSRNCVPWSFIGFPAISTPCGITSNRLPIGLQLVGAPFTDGIILALASAFEGTH